MSAPLSTPEAHRAFRPWTTPASEDASHPPRTQMLMPPSPTVGLLLTELRPAQPPSELNYRPVPPKAPVNAARVISPKTKTAAPLATLPTPTSQKQDDAWSLISSIYWHPTDAAVRASACDGLRVCNADFFLPQLCLLLVYLPPISDALERLILDKCAKSVHFALQCICCLGVMAPPEVEDPSLAERITNFRYACELAYISGHRPQLGPNASPIEATSSSTNANEETVEIDSVKDARFKYLRSLKKLLLELANTGNELGKTAEAERPLALRTRLAALNLAIKQSVETPDASPYSPGLYLPLVPSTNNHSSLVKILEHEAVLLSSRSRVPFQICFESICLTSEPPLVSDEHLESYLPTYSATIAPMMSNTRATPTRSPIATPAPSLPPSSPETSSVPSSSSALASSMPVPISSSIRTPSPGRTGSFGEGLAHSFPTSSPSAPLEHHLQHLLSVPQNTNSLRTKELWSDKEVRIRTHSQFGHHEGWHLGAVIVKYGADSLQEQLALQLTKFIADIFQSASLCARLVTYDCMVIEGEASLIQALLTAESVHQIKKKNNHISLYDYFVKRWDGPSSPQFERAQMNFMETLAGSSLLCYLLQLKDRHNGNIMIDEDGNIVHIDWGYLLWNTPGAIGWESAPFKLTTEMVSVLNGPDSPLYLRFKQAFLQGFLELRRRHKEILDMVRFMLLCDPRKVPCAEGRLAVADALLARFCIHLSDEDCAPMVENLISQAFNNWRTNNYDYFQYYTNGIH